MLKNSEEKKIIIGYEQHYEEGLQQGRAEAFMEVAREMLASGIPVSEVSSITGVSAVELGVNPA